MKRRNPNDVRRVLLRRLKTGPQDSSHEPHTQYPPTSLVSILSLLTSTHTSVLLGDGLGTSWAPSRSTAARSLVSSGGPLVCSQPCLGHSGIAAQRSRSPMNKRAAFMSMLSDTDLRNGGESEAGAPISSFLRRPLRVSRAEKKPAPHDEGQDLVRTDLRKLLLAEENERQSPRFLN